MTSPALTLKYWHSPFHGQTYGVALCSSISPFTLFGGKYQLPSMWMSSLLSASARTVSFSTAFTLSPSDRCYSVHNQRRPSAIPRLDSPGPGIPRLDIPRPEHACETGGMRVL